MKANRRLMGILVLYAILIFGPAGNVLGQNQNAPDDRGHFRMRLWTSLTQEQRQAVWSTVAQMRDQGASPEEIHSAVARMLKGYGIEKAEIQPKTSPAMASTGLRIIAQSHPNPFNPETQIKYTLTAPGEVWVKIYNVTGEVVRTFDEGYRAAGNYTLQWDGCDANGNRASSGIYLYRIEAGPYSATGRMVLLR